MGLSPDRLAWTNYFTWRGHIPVNQPIIVRNVSIPALAGSCSLRWWSFRHYDQGLRGTSLALSEVLDHVERATSR